MQLLPDCSTLKLVSCRVCCPLERSWALQPPSSSLIHLLPAAADGTAVPAARALLPCPAGGESLKLGGNPPPIPGSLASRPAQSAHLSRVCPKRGSWRGEVHTHSKDCLAALTARPLRTRAGALAQVWIRALSAANGLTHSRLMVSERTNPQSLHPVNKGIK